MRISDWSSDVCSSDLEALDVLDAAQVAAAAHHVFGLGHFDHAAANVAVASSDHLGHPRDRDVELAQADRIHRDRVLAHEAADAGHLGHAGRGGEIGRAAWRERAGPYV